MIRKIIVCLVAATFLVVGCGSSDEFSSTSYSYVNPVKADYFTSTWYGYLNPGQMPTLTDIKNYYNSFGSYPTLSDEQFTYIVNRPCL
jgi:hypothetical protein